MVRILFIWPPKVEYAFSIQKHYTTFGETIAFLDRYEDFEIDVMDGSALLYFQWDFIEAYARQYDFLVVYTDLHNSMSAIKAAQQCKRISPNTTVISYGQGTPYAPEVYLHHGFEVAVVDPLYEKSIANFILYRQGRIDKRNLKGLLFKENSHIVQMLDTREYDISEMAFPALEKLPVGQYKRISGRDQLCFTVARGCAYNCRFCRVPVADGNIVSYRPIADIINYLERVKDDFASIKFIAPIFTHNREWVLEFCDEIMRHNLNFKWIVVTRVELLDAGLLSAMSRAGCICIAFGMETLFVETQKRVDKYLPRDLLISQINLIHKYNIIPKAFIMLGIPGQTREEIEDMYVFLKNHKVEIRPKEYYPYELFFSEKNKLELLGFFERDDVYKTRLPNVATYQFVQWMMDRTNVR